VQLPVDFPKTPAAGVRLEQVTFELPEPSGATGNDARLVSLFAIVLARYGNLASVTLRATRVTKDGEARGWSRLHCETPSESTYREVARRTEALLSETPTVSRSGPAGDEHRASVTWIDVDLDPAGVLDVCTERAADVDVNLVVMRRGAMLVYNATLFRRTTIERLAGHLGVLAAGAAERPDAPISRLPMLADAERRWLDAMCRGATRPTPAEHVHRIVERHAAETPNAPAVRFQDGVLSYAALNARANQLARRLVAQGVGAEDRVVVCIEPALDIAVALLAILKAGGVYVPLDPGYPESRIRTILEDTAPALVLTQEHLIARLPFGANATLALDTGASLLDAESTANLDRAIELTQTAYVYSTSGTTGKPKGVMASHANLAAYVEVARERYAVDRRDVIPALARFSFSISMFELMVPLVAGGTLIVLEREIILDPPRLAKALTKVTLFHAGPSLQKSLLAYVAREPMAPDAFAHVRHASSGGDAIAPEVLEGLKRVFANAEIFVIYGCSEIACMGCTYPVPRDREVTKTYVGRPFANMTVAVLDPDRNLVPAGVVGEVYFAGDGVVKGYLDRPELTAERFLVLDGRRFYRTGDMGRLSDDGWLELVGRNDFQVKVRGMRIELPEVEYHLRRAHGVVDGVVMGRRGADGETALVAYVVLGKDDAADHAPRVAAIRRHMAAHVPDYMVPAQYVTLERLPLNHNMKVDRFALPAPESAASAAHVRAPETPTAERLARIWARTLRVDPVGLDDNFFALGGDSMLALELVRDVECELGVRLDGMDVLRETLEVLAAITDARLGVASPATRQAHAPASGRIDAFHFGEAESLYGVLHAPIGAPADRAVLVCAPLGQEEARAHFVLVQLGKLLASRGIASMRFDFFGCADSMGDSTAATCLRWQQDIVEAYAELKRRTGATRIAAVGVRFGATLLWNARSLDVERLVLWDPVGDGSAHYAELAKMRRAYERGTQHLRGTMRLTEPSGDEELAGLVLSQAMLQELKALAITRAEGAATPSKWLATTDTHEQQALFDAAGGGTFHALDAATAWNDVARVDDIVPDVGISKALAAMLGDAP
jgi:amino acid adenylation domain-containing protein